MGKHGENINALVLPGGEARTHDDDPTSDSGPIDHAVLTGMEPG